MKAKLPEPICPAKYPTHRFYIRATGGHCYDETGVTFPIAYQVNLVELVKDCVPTGSRISWVKQFGWSNQPPVLCFTATHRQADSIDKALPHGLMTETKW